MIGRFIQNDSKPEAVRPAPRPVPSPPVPVPAFVADPKILTHPNIPKPLHGLNPRSLKGQEWWDKTRKAAYASTGFRCLACGVPKAESKGPRWLEGHEYWNVDYQRGIATVERIVPLCHYCHNFIHSGRLLMIAGKEKTKEECVEILEHGFQILKANKLRAFPVTLDVARLLGAKTFGVLAYKIKVNEELRWQDWKMVLDGQEYRSNFSDAREWRNHYRKMDDPDPWANADGETEDYAFAHFCD